MDRQLESIQKSILRDIHGRLMINTPIDTGRLISSYKVSKDSISNNTPYAYYVERGTEKQKAQLFMKKSIEEVIK